MDSYFPEMFALSLPKDGKLLHPKVSSGKSSKPEVDSQSSVVKVSQSTPGKKSGRTQVSESPTRSGRQEGNNGQEGGNTLLSEQGPSHQAAKDKYECTLNSCWVFMYFMYFRIFINFLCSFHIF